jgi:hypothetical protein
MKLLIDSNSKSLAQFSAVDEGPTVAILQEEKRVENTKSFDVFNITWCLFFAVVISSRLCV